MSALEGLDWQKLFEMVRPYFEAMDHENVSMMQFAGGGADGEPIAMIVLVIDSDRIQQVAVTLDILRSDWGGGEGLEIRHF